MRNRTIRGRSLVVGGLICSIAALAGWWSDAVVAASPEPVVGVGLDEIFTVALKTPSAARRTRAPEVFAESTTTRRRATSIIVRGRLLYDRQLQRAVVVSPAAIRDFYEVAELLPFERAQKKADRVIKQAERTGRTNKIDQLSREWVALLGAESGASLRIDTPAAFHSFPPTQQVNGVPADGAVLAAPLAQLRSNVAGDDALWSDYWNGDPTAFPQLNRNSQFQRFFHEVDKETGLPAARSRLRERQYRRVLINRRGRFATYLPELPTSFNDDTAGLREQQSYELTFPKSVARAIRKVTTSAGVRLPRTGNAFEFTTSGTRTYRQPESLIGVASLPTPRVINCTPPNGERRVDPSTDWEDPDNNLEVPIQARRTFVIRARWSHPLDPRSTTTASVTVTKIAQGDQIVSEQIPVNVDLIQSRLGDVTLEITPLQNLDPQAEFEVKVDGNNVLALTGDPLGTSVVWTFQTR